MNEPLNIPRMIMIAALFGLLCDSVDAQPTTAPPDSHVRWALALHGGAGRISRDLGPNEREELEGSLQHALAAGREILAKGGSALDVVEIVVATMEDDSRFNAGKGAVFTSAGTHELDASIMEGATLRCGAVAGIKFQKNLVKVARLVMERSPHVLLAGEGADAFAIENGCQRIGQEFFYTERRFRELQQALSKQGREPLLKPAYPVPTDAKAAGGAPSKGTVGCVALDSHGNLAAATSTGGVTGKRPGRIGDTPIIGAGNLANKTCAVSCTGTGEQFIRHSIASRVAWLMEDRKLAVDDAVRCCLNEILQPGDGGLIALDRQGHIAMRASTGAMPRGIADSTGRFETAIWIDP